MEGTNFMGKFKDKMYNYFVRKNGRVWYEYERYVREHIEEHRLHRFNHICLLMKLNWFYRVKKGNTPYLYWDTPLKPISYNNSISNSTGLELNKNAYTKQKIIIANTKNSPINIALASNNNYVPYLSVCIQSIIASTSMERRYNIYILHKQINDKNISAIKKIQTENVRIKFFNVSKMIESKKLYTRHHISEETYYRALLPELFPNNNKIVYIDCDLVVLKDIAELYDADIRDYLIGAVKNYCNQFIYDYIEREIQISPYKYFNAGVLLINLQKFREADISHKFLEMVAGERQYNLMDQDILNILCNKNILYIDDRWNVSWQHVFQRDELFSLRSEYRNEYEQIIKDPFIVHYTSEKKPWDYQTAPLANYFWDFAQSNELFIKFNNKKRILLVTHEMEYAGSEYSLKKVCLVLKNAGYRVDVWSYQMGDYVAEFKKADIQIKEVSEKTVFSEENKALYKHYDLIIANTIFTYGIVKAAQDIVPVIWYIREAQNIPLIIGSNREMLEMMYKAYTIYTVSEYARDFISENYNPNVNVIHNCVDDEYGIYGEPHVPLKKGAKVKILTMGTIEDRKGYDIYFHAYFQLPKEYKKKCELHFCGRTAPWAKEYAEELFREIEPYNNIIYHGEIQDRSVLLKLVDSMDVIAVTSRDESCSLVALEGAMMKKPLLVTKNVGAKYLVNKNTGWVVNADDTDSLAKAYIDIIDNTDKLCEMGESARLEYLRTSTFDAFSKKIVEMASTNIYESKSDFSAHNEKSRKNQIPIDEAKYSLPLITYDIFDTVLTRATATPKGIFALMQYHLMNNSKFVDKSAYIRENFYDLRINAESYARNALISRQKNEITLDEIYTALGMIEETSYATLQEIKALEEKIEYNASMGIEENIKNIIALTKKKQNVAFVSDMYLSKAFIRRLLNKANPILSKQPIYVSSQSNAVKSSGGLFKQVKNENRIAFGEWKHIGDNQFSDCSVAEKLGIKTEHYTGSQLLPFEKRLIDSEEKNPYIQLAVGAARNARLNSCKDTIAFKAGASAGGVLIYPYVRWILQNANNHGLTRLYFIARDGYLLKKAADIIIEKFGYNISTYYIYGSRQAWRIPALNADKYVYESIFRESLFHFVTNIDDIADIFQIDCKELFEFIPCNYRKEHISLSESDVDRIKEILIKNNDFEDYLCDAHKEKYNNSVEYLKQEIDVSDNQFAFVELNGSGFTQYCLRILMKGFYDGPVITYYFKLTSLRRYDSEKLIFINYLPNNLKAAHIIEAFCRAPHGQTVGYKKQQEKRIPVFDEAEGKAIINYGFEDYKEGIAKFCEYLSEAEKILNFPMTSCSVPLKCLNQLADNPDKELLDFICDMPFGASGREKYVTKFAPKLTDEQIRAIYEKRVSLHTVYDGASLDMSLKRCSESQLKLKEKCEKRSSKTEEKTINQKKKIKTVGRNYLQQGDMSRCRLLDAKNYSISQNSENAACFKVDGAEGFIHKGDYVSVYRSKKRKFVLNSAEVTRVSNDAVYYIGKEIKTEVGDTVTIESRITQASPAMIFDNWYCNSANGNGLNVKMKSGIQIVKPYTSVFEMMRSGFILPIPNALKGQYVTLSIKFENRKNYPELAFVTSKNQIGIQTTGLPDEKKDIVSDEYESLTSFIPDDHKYMRIMVQCPGKEEKGILLQKIKLEIGLESTIENDKTM